MYLPLSPSRNFEDMLQGMVSFGISFSFLFFAVNACNALNDFDDVMSLLLYFLPSISFSFAWSRNEGIDVFMHGCCL